MPTNQDLSVFVVLQKDNKFYIHNTNNTNNTNNIKNTIIEYYKNERGVFDDVSMMKSPNGTTESFNVNGTKKSFADINSPDRFGENSTDSTDSTGSTGSTGSTDSNIFDRPLGGGKPPSHPKYKKRTTSQKRRKLNIKTLKLKS